MSDVLSAVLYGALLLSLFLMDYTLGNGFVNMIQKTICKFVCFIRKAISEEAKHLIVQETTISLPALFGEIMFLGLTMMVLNKYKQFHGKDRIDELLQESREALRQTNEFLEKWRLRRLNNQAPSQHSYLDDEPQKIEPLQLEVPILHMAIVDTLGTTRSQMERGDAGDTINIADSTLLSVTSLIDDDMDSLDDHGSDDFTESKVPEFHNRYLWDVMEEDVANLEY